ncbi:AMP-binding protein [Rhodococcus opacus]|uniref:AMP-binding protein n=1 Tax=Rhodococcus opacus TaxID=37919 RepID=UPI00287735FD|nr:AMP-binding protein [Rhodococcus opacus]
MRTIDVSFGTILEAVAEAVPDRIAISTPDSEYTYAQFEERSARLATALQQSGVAAGDTVACYLYNSAAYLETVFAAFKIGAVPVNANYRYTSSELASLLTDADARALVYSDQLAANVDGIVDAVPTLAVALRAGGKTVGAATGDDLDGVIAAHPPLPQAPRPGTDTLFMYTGGTTGRPKGVIWRHRDLLHSLAVPVYRPVGRDLPTTIADAVDAAREASVRGMVPVTMPVVPLMHATGLFNTIGTMLLGGTVVLADPGGLDPSRVWSLVQDKHVKTIIVAGNAVCSPLIDELTRSETNGQSYDLSNLRTVLSSGTAFSDHLKQALHERADVTIIDAIGSSEGGPFVFATTSSTDDLPAKFFPVPATKVFDEHDNEVLPGSGTTGVLAYSGPSPLGYYKDEGKTALTFRVIGGVRYSLPGDFVEVHEDGSIRFLGRQSGVINTGGEKVHPQEVEDVLLTHPDVRDCVVVGAPDPKWGEQVAAVVAIDAASTVTEEDLQNWVRQELAGYKVPRTVVLLGRLPRTPTGKIEISWAKQQVTMMSAQ